MRRQNPQPEKDRIDSSRAPETGPTAASARKRGLDQKTPTAPEQSDPDRQAASVGNCSTVWGPSEDDAFLPQKSSPKSRRNRKFDFVASPSRSEGSAAGSAKTKRPRLPISASQRPAAPEGSAKPRRRRLPSLQEVLDAFEPEDEYLEPDPEPGDFWAEPDDWPMD